MEKCGEEQEEEEGEPIWLEDSNSDEEVEEDNESDEEAVSLEKQSSIASQSTQSISLNALKNFAGTVHSTSNHLQSLDISAGDWSLEYS